MLKIEERVSNLQSPILIWELGFSILYINDLYEQMHDYWEKWNNLPTTVKNYWIFAVWYHHSFMFTHPLYEYLLRVSLIDMTIWEVSNNDGHCSSVFVGDFQHAERKLVESDIHTPEQLHLKIVSNLNELNDSMFFLAVFEVKWAWTCLCLVK